MRLILSALILFALSACTQVDTIADKGYEFGDTTKSLLVLQSKYCSEASPVERAALLTVIRSYAPAYPLTGACTDPMKIFDYATQDIEPPENIVTPDQVQNDIVGADDETAD